MKSILSKVILTLVASMTAALVAVLLVDYFYMSRIETENSTLTMQHALDSLAEELNHQVHGVEQSTDTMYEYAMEMIKKSPEVFGSSESLDSFIDGFRSRADYDANNTYGAITTYFALNPRKYGVRRGFFLTRKSRDSAFEPHELTNILEFDEKDLEHVGWYYIPIKTGGPTWMPPYLNKNIGIWMISYVIPVFDKSGDAIGVVGMDMDYSLIDSLVSDAYVLSDNGSAALFDANGNLLYQKDYAITLADDSDALKNSAQANTGDSEQDERSLWDAANVSLTSGGATDCTFNGTSYVIVSKKLANDMTLVAMTPKIDVYMPIFLHLLFSALIVLVIMLISGSVAAYVMHNVTLPLRKLARASQEISDGNLDVKIDVHTQDEVGQLATTFAHMASELKSRMRKMNEQAFFDSLTGIGNRAAYERAVDDLSERMSKGTVNFTLIIFDLNGLKLVNDNDGHKAGDALIMDAAHAISSVFGNENTYRYGGDEFAAILEGGESIASRDWANEIQGAVASINDAHEKPGAAPCPYSVSLSIAYGIATYDPQRHASYAEVFNEADDEMYENKRNHN